MSVRINASGEYLRRTANLPSSTAFTMCGWAKITRRTSAYQYWGLEDKTSSSTKWLLIGYDNLSFNDLTISFTSGYTEFASSPTDDTWFFWAITCAGTGAADFKGYWAHAADTSFKTVTGQGESFTVALMSVGNDGYDEWCNSAHANVKIYDAALTEAELWNEMWRLVPVRTASLHLWTPLWSINDIADYSGNAKNWTSGGTVSSEDNPPVSYGAPVWVVPTSAASVHTVTVNQASETDSTQAVARQKVKAVGQASETDSVQAITRQKVKAVGQASETDSTQAVARQKVKAVGQAEETDTPLAIGRSKAKSIGIVAEVDSAQIITPAKSMISGIAAETDEAQAVTSRKILSLAQVSETDEAQAIASVKIKLLGQAEEIDTALPFGTQITETIGQATETDVPLSVTARKIKIIGMVTETDEPLAIAGIKVKTLGQSTETNEALAILRMVPTIVVAVGQVVETNTAFAILAGPFYGVATLSDSVVHVASVSDSVLWSASLTDLLVIDASASDSSLWSANLDDTLVDDADLEVEP